MEPETKGIRYQSATYPAVQNLMHNVSEQTLMAEHRKQARKKATGIDGVDKTAYDENAEENIRELVIKMKKFQYRPQAVRRTYIPKANGKMRPPGIPAYEDRLVQGVMAGLLNEVYEVRFLDCSYGFRPKRSGHDVVRYINQTIMTKKVNYALEADIKGFFDNVDHDWLMKFLEHDIQDKNFLRYIKRFLIAGIMEGTERTDSDRGTPQGGLISPVLANVYTLMPAQLFPEIQTKGCPVVSVCENFVQPGEILYHFADMADAHFLREGKRQTPEALFQYARELYGSKWLYQMLIFDALIGNEDRHENNFDVLLREGTPVPPPLYDNGASLLAWVSESEMTEQALRYEFDRSKPFRSRHEKQVRLVDQPVFPKQEPDAVLRTILKAVEPTLGLLSEKRAQAIRMYLRYRMPYLEKAMG